MRFSAALGAHTKSSCGAVPAPVQAAASNVAYSAKVVSVFVRLHPHAPSPGADVDQIAQVLVQTWRRTRAAINDYRSVGAPGGWQAKTLRTERPMTHAEHSEC